MPIVTLTLSARANGKLVWSPNRDVSCSKYVRVIEQISFENVSDNIKSRYYKPGLLKIWRRTTSKEKKLKIQKLET